MAWVEHLLQLQQAERESPPTKERRFIPRINHRCFRARLLDSEKQVCYDWNRCSSWSNERG